MDQFFPSQSPEMLFRQSQTRRWYNGMKKSAGGWNMTIGREIHRVRLQALARTATSVPVTPIPMRDIFLEPITRRTIGVQPTRRVETDTNGTAAQSARRAEYSRHPSNDQATDLDLRLRERLRRLDGQIALLSRGRDRSIL